MQYNTKPEFVGIPALIDKHREQIEKFELWASRGAWMDFHYSHYDWWTFPIDKPSNYGFRYVVYEGEIAQLKADDGFMTRFRRGVELLSTSWGWDVHAQKPMPEPTSAQTWQQWPIRLQKAAHSSHLFGEQALFDGLCVYALTLIAAKESFWYNGRDLSTYFTP